MASSGKVVALPKAKRAQKLTATTRPSEAALFEKMIDGYRSYRLGSRGHIKASVERDIKAISSFQAASGLYPWEWGIDSWNAWNTQLLEVGLGRATRRMYQGAIDGFIAYIVRSEVFRIEVRNQFGAEVLPFLMDEDRLHHLYTQEEKEPSARFTERQANLLIAHIKLQIEKNQHLPPVNGRPHRILLNLQRDLVVVCTFKVTGLRAGSVIALNIYSFIPNPKIPEMDEFGIVHTIGKGSNGSGPKPNEVMIDDPRLPGILKWYVSEVRPWFLSANNPNELAFFLAEGGRRMSYGTLWYRLNKHITDAGLGTLGLSSHSFRHYKATAMTVSGHDIETTRSQLNHNFSATTQGYIGVTDKFAENQINRAIRTRLDALKKSNSHDDPREKTHE